MDEGLSKVEGLLHGEGSVDPESVERLVEAEISIDDLENKSVSYRDLVDAGVDAAVATELRRHFSLPWTFELGSDLSERSGAVGALSSHEREWVELSDGEWQDNPVESSIATPRKGRDVWADLDRPTPVTALPGISADHAERLTTAGVTSIKQLTFLDAGVVAEAIGVDVKLVRLWRHQARGHYSRR
ncbi:MAG: hypothetical protein ACI8VE_001849 [Natrialbaceae archaeon]